MSAEIGSNCSFASAANAASQWLEENPARALLIEGSSELGEQVALEARSHKLNTNLPIFSVVRRVDDLSFADVFSWGGDDVVQLSPSSGLLTRLRGLPEEQRSQPGGSRGTCVIADPDRIRRVVLARVLGNAGYEITFALSLEDVSASLEKEAPTLIAVDMSISETLPAFVRGMRLRTDASIIITCAPRELPECTKLLHGAEKMAAMDSYAPPENVLFLANELERGELQDMRSSRRLLYGTAVAFRPAGRETDDYGYCYNISEGGLFVRTLAPPSGDKVWLELQPPRTDRRIRLEGEVVWRRPYGPAHSATVPPGFGVRITDATRADQEAWQRGYQSFAENLGYASTG